MGKVSAARSKRAPISSDIVLPDKLYFRMREVSRMTKIEPYVLRFWETQFPQLKPTKARSRHRLFRREDILTILEIKDLLYEQGYTIHGARKKLTRNSENQNSSQGPFAGRGASDLQNVGKELQRILTILSRE